MTRRLGAYVLPGDPVWLWESLGQYYPLLDDLVVPVPSDGRGWSGVPIPVDDCLRVVREVDVRGIAREIPGVWTNRANPMSADTAQRQCALESLANSVDWVVQLDNDEFIPRPEILLEGVERAEELGLDAVELPMRVLFRRTMSTVFEVAGPHHESHHEYPGSVLVRPSIRLRNARQVEGRYLRMAARGAMTSMQLSRPAADDEVRDVSLQDGDAIVHNSWARTPEEIRRKVATWGHSGDANFSLYYWLRWWPVPWTWWLSRNFHPFVGGLWPRLRRLSNEGVVADHPRSSGGNRV